ncbi:MAG: DUF3810 family protein [Clostridia bacterium]
MKKIINAYKNKKVVAITVLVVLMAVLLLLKLSVAVCEYVFARGISRGYLRFVGLINVYLPFSIFEMLCIVAVLFVLFTIVKCICERKNKKAVINRVLTLILAVFSVVNLYIITVGMTYNRKPMQLNVESYTLKDSEFVDIYEFLAQDYSNIEKDFKKENGLVKSPYSFEQLSDMICKEFGKLDSYFNKVKTRAKPILFSGIMSNFGILGITFAPTAEANVNIDAPQQLWAFSIAHEFAHINGVMSERDANILAFYVLYNSGNNYLKLCAYDNYLSEISTVVLLYNEQTFKDIFVKLPQSYSDCTTFLNNFWLEQQQNGFNKIGNFFNNIYLKLSGIADGTNNYIVPSDPIITDDKNEFDRPTIIYNLNTIQAIMAQEYFSSK